jgi:hypothetical protein
MTSVTILVGTEYHKKIVTTSGDGGSIPYFICCRKDKLPVAVIQINCKHLRKSIQDLRTSTQVQLTILWLKV